MNEKEYQPFSLNNTNGRTILKIAKLSLILSLECVSEWVQVEPLDKAVAED